MRPLTLLLCGLLLIGSARADETVIYRCTAADGSLSLQSMPCAAGQKSEVRRLSADYAPPSVQLPPASAPVPAPEALPAAVPAAAMQAPVDPPAHMALPILHHCQPRSGAAYYTDRLEETVRCVPMRVTGLDGNPDTGAGQRPMPAPPGPTTWHRAGNALPTRPAAPAPLPTPNPHRLPPCSRAVPVRSRLRTRSAESRRPPRCTRR